MQQLEAAYRRVTRELAKAHIVAGALQQGEDDEGDAADEAIEATVSQARHLPGPCHGMAHLIHCPAANSNNRQVLLLDNSTPPSPPLSPNTATMHKWQSLLQDITYGQAAGCHDCACASDKWSLAAHVATDLT